MYFESKRSTGIPALSVENTDDKCTKGHKAIQIFGQSSSENTEINSPINEHIKSFHSKHAAQNKCNHHQSPESLRTVIISKESNVKSPLNHHISVSDYEIPPKFLPVSMNSRPITVSSSPSYRTTHDLLSHCESLTQSVSEDEDNPPLDQEYFIDAEEKLNQIRSHLNYLHKHESEHLKILEQIIKSLESVRDKRSSNEIKEIRSSLHSVENIQKKFLQGLSDCLQNGDIEYAHFSEPFKLLIGRQIEISNYVNRISKVLKNSKQEKHSNSSNSFRLQEPMTWIAQTAENIKSLLLLLDKNSVHYPELQRIYKRLLEESLNSREEDEEISTHDSDHLIMHSLVVELAGKTNSRKLRYLFLFKDVLICAKPKLVTSLRQKLSHDDPSQNELRFRRNVSLKLPISGHELEIKWFIYTDDICLLTNSRFGNDDRGRLQQQRDLDKLKGMVRNLRHTMSHSSGERRSSKNSSKLTNLSKLEGKLVLETPQLILPIADKNSRVHNILLTTERERTHWRSALEQQSNKHHFKSGSLDIPKISTLEKANSESSLAVSRNPTLTELHERLKKYEHVVTLNKVGLALLGKNEPVTGFIKATIHGIDGLDEKNSYHVCIEVDSYGQYEEVARTRVLQQANPQWEQSFDLEVDGAWTMCFTLNIHQEMLAELEVPLDLETLKQNSVTVMKVPTNENPPRDLVFTISLEYIDQMNLNKNRRSEIPGNLFGRHLKELIKVPLEQGGDGNMKKQKSEVFIPRFVTACVEEIERRGLLEVGIYRICGSNDDIKALKSEFDESCKLAIQRLTLVQLPVITSLLKQFFQQLPESLIDYASTKALVQAVEIDDESFRYQLIYDILYQLPTVNLEIFNYLANHLITVSRYREQNKMNLGNLSLIWSMTLFECAPEISQSSAATEKDKGNSKFTLDNVQMQAAFGFQQAKTLNCILTSMISGKLTIPHHNNVIRPEHS